MHRSLRLTGLAFALCLGAGTAFADSPLEAYAPLKVVGIMPDTNQVLVWDEAATEYKIAKVGDTIEGWKVLEIAAREKRVTVAQDDIRDDLVLTRLPRSGALVTYGSKVVPAPAAPPAPRTPPGSAPTSGIPGVPAALPTPVPPTATVAPGPNAPVPTDMLAAPGAEPLDPYGPPPGRPAADADAQPLDPYAAQAVPLPPVTPSQPTVIQDDGGAGPGPGASDMIVERHVLRRGELDREINDFDRLMATVRVAPANGGGFVLVKIEPISWLASIGMRQGDVVRSIAGETVSTVDDAARVYARLRSLSSFIVEIQRGPRRVLLDFDVR